MNGEESKLLILKNLQKNYITESELARFLGITPQTLNYQLNLASKFDVDLFEDIKKFFDKKGYPLQTISEKKNIMTNITLEISALTNQGLSVFNRIIEDALRNGTIKDTDKDRMIRQLDVMLLEVTEKVDEIKILLTSN